MRLVRKTQILLVVALLAAVLNFFEQPMPEKAVLPMLPKMLKDELTRIELTSAAGKISLQKDGAEWNLLAPIQGKADQARVRSLILNFRKNITMDVMLERENVDKYGLDPNNVIVVEMWTTGETPKASFSVGLDASHGTSFVRLSGDDAIYRARIGGRNRFAHPVSGWQNQVLLDFQPNSLQSVEIKGQKSLQVAQSNPGTWELTPRPPWSVDERKIKLLLQRLGRLRIGKRSDEVLQDADLTITCTFVDAPEKVLRIKLGSYALVQIQGEKTVYQLAASIFAPLTQGWEPFRDLRIFSYQPRDHFDTVQYESKQQKIVLQQDLAKGFWRVVEPSHIDLELKNIFFMVNSLATLEAERIEDNVAEKPLIGTESFRLQIRLLNGQTRTLYVWLQEKGAIAKTANNERFFIISAEMISKIHKAFGLGK